MKIKTICHLLLASAAVLGLLPSCSEEIDTSNRYTFTGKTIISYLKDFPETYSEYIDLLDSVNVSDFSDSKLSQLLSARGNYTCFAPTNDAIRNYLAHLVDSGVISEPDWDAPEFQKVNPNTNERDLLIATRKTIVYNSLIDGGDEIEAYMTSDFSDRAELNNMLGLPNMYDRKLQVSLGNGTKYAINGCNISDTNCDIYAINGRIHQVDKVISPSTQTVAQYFDKTITDKQHGYYTCAVLIKACGFLEELSKSEDETYYHLRMTGQLEDLPQHPTYKGAGGPEPHSPGTLPEHRYYGFTIFAEEDEWWEKVLGLTFPITELSEEEVLDKVSSYVNDHNLHLPDANTGTDYTATNNSLNQFVTYHMIPGKIESSKLVIHFNELWYNGVDQQKQSSVMDYYTCMGTPRLLKAYEASETCEGKRNAVYLNRFPVLDNARAGKYTEISCEDNKRGVEVDTKGVLEMYNGYIYKISDCLYFNDDIAETFGKERIRFDVTTLFPEFFSNDIRCNENYRYDRQCVGIPVSSKYRYLENCDISDNTRFYYLSGRFNKTYWWASYQGDELNIVGNYEVTLKLPPVPKDGVYELRLALNVNDRRGMFQVFWGTNKTSLPASGVPIDMRMGGTVWYVKGGSSMESILGYEIDVDGDDELNAENDKKMRNNGYMKGPNVFYGYGESTSVRYRPNALRRIIVREEMKANQTYYVSFKSVLRDPDTEFSFDYMELCPKEVYDNPLVPEDIW